MNPYRDAHARGACADRLDAPCARWNPGGKYILDGESRILVNLVTRGNSYWVPVSPATGGHWLLRDGRRRRRRVRETAPRRNIGGSDLFISISSSIVLFPRDSTGQRYKFVSSFITARRAISITIRDKSSAVLIGDHYVFGEARGSPRTIPRSVSLRPLSPGSESLAEPLSGI